MMQEDFLKRIAQLLETAGIPYMVAGSVGSGYYGQPRSTNDVDIVIDPTAEQLEQWLLLLGSDYYVSPEAARDALSRRFMFNVIDLMGGWKADLIVRKDRPFSEEEFRRRKTNLLHGQSIAMACAEDVILSKLEWNRITSSERQVRDALQVAVLQWANLDRLYLRK